MRDREFEGLTDHKFDVCGNCGTLLGVCRCRGGVDSPSPKLIRVRAAEIRARWTPTEMLRRLGMPASGRDTEWPEVWEVDITIHSW